jgi:hypothetical protein
VILAIIIIEGWLLGFFFIQWRFACQRADSYRAKWYATFDYKDPR